MNFSTFKNKTICRLDGLFTKEESAVIARHIFADLSGQPYERVHPLDTHSFLDEEKTRQAMTRLDALKTKMPLQYVLGFVYFYGYPFKVSPAALIPRPETEELVERVALYARARSPRDMSCIDIGTGSGCIAVSLKKTFPTLRVTAIDISGEAIALAEENARALHADVSFERADIAAYHPPHSFDMLVSNPPYVLTKEKKYMDDMVLNYEPHIALFEPENQPLYYYAQIADWAKKYVKGSGKIFLEINESKGKEVAALFREKGFPKVEIEKDYNGKDRFVFVSR